MTAVATGGTATGPASGTGGTASGGPGRRGLGWLAIVAGLLVGVLLLGAPNQEGPPFLTSSNGKRGTKALVALLETYGAVVVDTAEQPPPDTDVALAFPRRIPSDRTEAMRSWVREGHTLVVVGPRSELSPFGGPASAGGISLLEVDREQCDIAALDGVNRLEIDGGTRFEVGPGAQGCFANELGALVVAVPEGEGQIVSIGFDDVFSNRFLAEEDNAALATALLAPEPGTRVAVLGTPVGELAEPAALSDLLSTGVRLAVVQGVVAFVLYAFVRGRRLGRPILEPQPVLIAGSELVSAVGNLLQQSADPNRAAAVLRADLRRSVAERLGVPRDAGIEALVEVAAARSGADPERLGRALFDHPVTSEADLLALATLVDDVREEIFHGPAS